jgi:predicted transcriptional regulator
MTTRELAHELQDLIDDEIRERGLSDWRTAAQAAELMGISKSAVLAQCKRGTLYGEQVGGIWLIHAPDIKRKLDRGEA